MSRGSSNLLIVMRMAPVTDPSDQKYADAVRPRTEVDRADAALLDRGLMMMPQKQRRILVDWYVGTLTKRQICRKHDLFFTSLDRVVQESTAGWEDMVDYLQENQRVV